MSVKIMGKLPPDDSSGIGALAPSLSENPLQTIVVIGVLTVSKEVLKHDNPDDPRDTVLRFLALEPLQTGSKLHEQAVKALDEARYERTGVQRLEGF